MTPEIVLHPDGDAVAEAIASRLTARLTTLQQGGTAVPQVSLTGGRIATKAYQRLAEEGSASGVDWASVELWWSDERWVAATDADRNDTATIAALTGTLPIAVGLLHPMPSTDSGLDLDAGASAYATELAGRAFDVTLLGVGPDGHVASIFPGHPSADATGEVIAVRNSPKPPPERISLTLDALNRSREIWFTVSGEDKAEAVARALTRGDVPAGRVHGTERTLWLLDEAAASQLPPDLRPSVS